MHVEVSGDCLLDGALGEAGGSSAIVTLRGEDGGSVSVRPHTLNAAEAPREALAHLDRGTPAWTVVLHRSDGPGPSLTLSRLAPAPRAGGFATGSFLLEFGYPFDPVCAAARLPPSEAASVRAFLEAVMKYTPPPRRGTTLRGPPAQSLPGQLARSARKCSESSGGSSDGWWPPDASDSGDECEREDSLAPQPAATGSLLGTASALLAGRWRQARGVA
jgi:hypothetical protein